MSFDYDKISHKHNEHGSWWTSYADLFMMLSVVFLLMYVASSIRTGSVGFQQQQEYKRLARRAEDLEEQIKVYNTLKDEALKKQSSEAEQQVYQKLMDKLSLLKDQAHQEKEDLEQQAKENSDKEFALNQYQQLIRNIINANVLAKSQIAHRDQTIEEKQEQLGLANQTIHQTQQELGQANQTLEQRRQELAQLESEKSSYLSEMDTLKRQHNTQLSAERAAFKAKLKRQRLSAAEKSKRLARFLAGERQKAEALEGKLDDLRGKVAETESKLAGTQSELQGTQQKLVGAEVEKKRALAAVQDLKEDLTKTRAIANARRELAKKISEQFTKAGLKGAVDPRTGEVTLDFGGEYFDTGSTALKPRMRATLDRFMPVYARSLFSDPKIAGKIASVEIVGFASATYKGRYVNPKSTSPKDKSAIEYNLKLSFGRANSIFKHVINGGELKTADRQELMPLLKVVGRGYLPEGTAASDLPDHMSGKEFCAKYDCKAAQKVIVKFNMKD